MKTILAAAAASLLVASGYAAKLGDPAAPISIAKWVKGEPVQLTDDKHIYVVEFWATWCPPCRTSIPHLTELQKQFKDKNVTIIGVTDEKESIVTPFVKKMAGKMDYRVAIDDKDKTSTGYMGAYKIGGIPHAFIVQEKKVLWHGHPMDGLDQALKDIIAGKYDISKAAAKQKAEALYEEFRNAAAEGDDATADKLGAQLQDLAKDGALPVPNFDPAAEKKQVRLMVLADGYRTAVFREDNKGAEDLAKELKALDPTINLDALKEEVALNKVAREYYGAVTGTSPGSDPKSLGEQLAAKVKGRPEAGNNLAWAILTDAEVKDRDIPLALQLAHQAGEDSHWKEPHIIDTYARALFDSGKKKEAVDYAEKALAAATPETRDHYENALKAYREGKTPAAQ